MSRFRRPRHCFPRCPVTGKVRFGEHRDATLALRDSRRARVRALAADETNRRREERSYRCLSCRGWHLTSLPARRVSATALDAGAGVA